MSIETRHGEKDILFDLLTLSDELLRRDEIKKVIFNLRTRMEQADIAQVENCVRKLKGNMENE